MSYPDAIKAVKKTGVPWPIVVMHLKHGLRFPETCGGCRRLGRLGNSRERRFCGLSYSSEGVDPLTVACGKWQPRAEETT